MDTSSEAPSSEALSSKTQSLLETGSITSPVTYTVDEALLSKAQALLEEGSVETPVLKCLLSRSKILRTAVESTPEEFTGLLENETLDIHGEALNWIFEHSEYFQHFLEVQSENGRCPDGHFILCPEEKQGMDGVNGYVFHLLKRYEQGEPIGEYKEVEDGFDVVWYQDVHKAWYHASIAQSYAAVLDYLMWVTEDPTDQIKELIECGLLVPSSTLGHSFTAKGKQRESKSAAAANGNNGNNNNNLSNYNSNYNYSLTKEAPRKILAPRLVINAPNGRLTKKKPSHRNSPYSKKHPGKRLSKKHPGKTEKKGRTMKRSRRPSSTA